MHNSDIDFMARFISYFDGEKDPRNLMVIFSILRVPMTEWDISTDAQVRAVFLQLPLSRHFFVLSLSQSVEVLIK